MNNLLPANISRDSVIKRIDFKNKSIFFFPDFLIVDKIIYYLNP